MKNEQMLKLSYETDMPAGDQIYCYLSCNVRINTKKVLQRLIAQKCMHISEFICDIFVWIIQEYCFGK